MPNDSPKLSAQDVLSRAEKEGIRFVDLQFTDVVGVVKSITIPVGGGSGSNLLPSGDAGALFADFADDGIVQSR